MLWPGALDIRNDGPDIRISQATAERRHRIGLPRRSSCLSPLFDGRKEPLVIPLPGLAALIKWRREHDAIRTSLWPTLLPFQIAAMTACAARRIDVLALCHQRRVRDIGAIRRCSGWPRATAYNKHDQCQHANEHKSNQHVALIQETTRPGLLRSFWFLLRHMLQNCLLICPNVPCAPKMMVIDEK